MKRLLRRTLTIAFALLLVLGLGNVLIFNALPKPPRLTEPVTVDYGAGDAGFRRTMTAMLQQPITAGNDIALLRDGEAIYAAMIEAIGRAERSVTFETYEFWGAASAGVLTDALVEAAERGVRVHALPDYVGSVLADADKFARMESAGVEVIRWREPSWYRLARFNHRTHRKLLVIDGREGFIGGANIADPWLPDDDGQAYRDNHFHVRGPVVASMQAAFAESWLDASGTWLHGDAYFPALPKEGDVAAQIVNSAPREGRHRVRPMFLYAIAAAEERITAATAYFYPDAAFLDALQAAAERGVEVHILVPGDRIDQGYLRHASVNRWQPMLEAGVSLYEYQPSMYHSKLMSIDDAWASIGSANLDNRSFRINDEANLNVYDEAFSRAVRELIEEDIAQAEAYSVEQWRDRAWHKRAFGMLGHIIGPHL